MSAAGGASALCVLLVAAGARRAIRRRPTPQLAALGVAVERLRQVLPGRSRADQLRVALEEIHGLLRTGWSLFGALRHLAEGRGPWSGEARSIVAEVERGVALFEAIDRWALAAADPVATAFADAVALAGTTGASQAWAIESALAMVDERRAGEHELRAATAQHRASAAALVAVPVAFAGALCLIDPRVAAFYATDHLGWICIVSGASLDGAGAWWLRRLIGAVS